MCAQALASDQLVQTIELAAKIPQRLGDVALEALRVQPVDLALEVRASLAPLLELTRSRVATRARRERELVGDGDRLGLVAHRTARFVGIAGAEHWVFTSRVPCEQSRRVAQHRRTLEHKQAGAERVAPVGRYSVATPAGSPNDEPSDLCGPVRLRGTSESVSLDAEGRA